MACVIAPSSSPTEPAAPSDLSGSAAPVAEPVLALARQAAQEEAGSAERVGDFLSVQVEDEVASTLSFAALDPGYRGWSWSVTVAQVGEDTPTVSEVLLLPGAQALVPPPWLPWSQRISGQDVGPGDLLPPPPDDERLVPGYLESDDPAVEDVALEVGLGRPRVLGFLGRLDAAERWHAGEFGPETPMAEQAPANCISCGFYVPLAGALGTALGACANEYSPADGRVVDAAFGCGAHSETEIDMPMMSAAADIVLDDGVLDVFPRGGRPAGGSDPAEPTGIVETVEGVGVSDPGDAVSTVEVVDESVAVVAGEAAGDMTGDAESEPQEGVAEVPATVAAVEEQPGAEVPDEVDAAGGDDPAAPSETGPAEMVDSFGVDDAVPNDAVEDMLQAPEPPEPAESADDEAAPDALFAVEPAEPLESADEEPTLDSVGPDGVEIAGSASSEAEVAGDAGDGTAHDDSH